MKNVLLVDDDYVTNFVNKKMLERTGLCSNIQIAMNGAEALDLLKQNAIDGKPNPDVILVDINMPIMGGFSFIAAFNELSLLNKSKIQIVILSSSDDPKDIAKAKKLDIKCFTKPISVNCLIGILDDMISLRQTG